MESGRQKHLAVAKWLYVFFFASIGAYFIYINIYFERIGLSGTQIGLLAAISPLVSLLLVPLWGMMSDRFSIVRTLLILAAGGAVLSAWGLSAGTTFLWLAAFSLLLAFFHNPILPLLDSIVLGLLGGRRDLYGRQRMWGSVGFIFVASGFGFLLQARGMHLLFYGFMALMTIFLLLAFTLPARPDARLSATAGRGLGRLVRQPAWIWYAAGMVIYNIAITSNLSFLGVYLTRMGAGTSLVGNALALGAVSELPFMMLSSRLIGRFGARAVLVFSCIAYALRAVLYALMPTPEWALGIGLMNGMTYALNLVSSIALIDQMAPQDLKATAMSLNIAIAALGNIIGSPLNGWLLDALGGIAMFAISGGIFLAAGILLWNGARVRSDEALPSAEPEEG